MSRLATKEIALYRKLLRARVTIPGFLPVGDGLVNGLWEDVIIFDPKTYRRIGFPEIEAWTLAPCERGQAIQYNLRYAGITEKQMHPEEFRGEILAYKQRMAAQWAKKRPLLKLMPDRDGSRKGKARGGRMIFTGLDPLNLVREHRVERSLYRPGLVVRRYRGEKRNSLCIILPVGELSLEAIRRYQDVMLRWCEQYDSVPVSRRGKFVPFPGEDKPRALSDRQCLSLYRKLRRRRNTLSNQVFLPPKGVRRPKQ
jgi:hypothetical protein